jgi:AcrR family transcriptional regulator
MTVQSVIGGAMSAGRNSKEELPSRKGLPSPDRKRVTQDERRAAILAAALDVFSEHGFAAARLDDVAQKAGVAKGTLYLYFPDKESLFEDLLLSLAQPILHRIEALSAEPGPPAPIVLEMILALFQKEVIGSGRERLLRLIICEGPRFPKIAEFYHREIVSKGREIIRKIATRGFERGELPTDAMIKFPQLFFAPLITAVVWGSLFSKFDPLDVPAMLDIHRKLMLGIKDEESAK